MATAYSHRSEDPEPIHNLRRVCSRKGPLQRQVRVGTGTSSKQTNGRVPTHQTEEIVFRGQHSPASHRGAVTRKQTDKTIQGRGCGASRGRGRGIKQATEDMGVPGRGRGTHHSRGTKRTQQTDPLVVQGRGRGRTRGRGGSRGKTQRGTGKQQRGMTSSRQGRGRGVTRHGYSNDDLTRVALLQQRRAVDMNERLARMGVKQLRHLLERIVTREPGMVFDVMESINPGGPPPSPSSNASDSWCTCGRCQEMPTDLERKCCGLIAPQCISILAEFDLLVIEPMYLRQFNRYRGQIYGIPGHGDNAAMRHAAYTQFTLLKHGKLGYQNRRVIPSCCVWRIRRTFPEQSGVYRSFVPVV